MAAEWNKNINNAINTKLSDLDNTVNNWANENIKNPIDEWSDNLIGNISIKMDGGPSAEDYKKVQDALGMDIENLNIRDKLIVECPDFMHQCGLSQIDFGNLFLDQKQENFIALTENVSNDVINTLNSLNNYVSPEAVEAAHGLVNFIIEDLTKTLIDYVMRTFQSYVSPGYALGLTKDLVTGAIRYRIQYTKDPAKLLDELIKDNSEALNEEKENKASKDTAKIMSGINEKFAATQDWIIKALNAIQPYTSEISKYMVYGPDYACSQVEAIYKKYLLMGISFVNVQVGKLDSLINDGIDSGAKAIGKWEAELFNKTQEKKLKKAKTLKDEKLRKVKVKALALVNKANMNLLAILGG